MYVKREKEKIIKCLAQFKIQFLSLQIIIVSIILFRKSDDRFLLLHTSKSSSGIASSILLFSCKINRFFSIANEKEKKSFSIQNVGLIRGDK